MCGEKIPLVSMRGQVEGQVCADPGARTPANLVRNVDKPSNISIRNNIVFIFGLVDGPHSKKLNLPFSNYNVIFVAVKKICMYYVLIWPRCIFIGSVSGN